MSMNAARMLLASRAWAIGTVALALLIPLDARGQGIHELYLIGNRVCWAFVDVLDAAREVENDKVNAEIKYFFGSLVIPKD